MNQVLASLSAEAAEVREYVDQLDAVRAKCAAAGEYRQAQASVDRMQQVNTRFAELVVGQACRLNDGEARRLRDAHALAALEAKKAWRESVAAFDLETAETLLRLERQQMLEIQDADAALCAPTLSSRSNGIHNSSASSRRGSSAADGEDPLLAPMAEVKALREALRRLAAQQRYLEADSAQRDLAVAEARLRALNHRQREARRGQRLRDVAARLHAQRAGAEERVYRGLQALCARGTLSWPPSSSGSARTSRGSRRPRLWLGALSPGCSRGAPPAPPGHCLSTPSWPPGVPCSMSTSISRRAARRSHPQQIEKLRFSLHSLCTHNKGN